MVGMVGEDIPLNRFSRLQFRVGDGRKAFFGGLVQPDGMVDLDDDHIFDAGVLKHSRLVFMHPGHIFQTGLA